jgi:hypothetical protein
MNPETPAADSQFEKVVAAFLEAVQAGRRPDRAKLLARFPELAERLESFLADHDRTGCGRSFRPPRRRKSSPSWWTPPKR